ncbi:Uncharacterised protein [Legionella maceachernii]|nr:Uncharacterised protein [Legionella maceachernii]
MLSKTIHYWQGLSKSIDLMKQELPQAREVFP